MLTNNSPQKQKQKIKLYSYIFYYANLLKIFTENRHAETPIQINHLIAFIFLQFIECIIRIRQIKKKPKYKV